MSELATVNEVVLPDKDIDTGVDDAEEDVIMFGKEELGRDSELDSNIRFRFRLLKFLFRLQVLVFLSFRREKILLLDKKGCW